MPEPSCALLYCASQAPPNWRHPVEETGFLFLPYGDKHSERLDNGRTYEIDTETHIDSCHVTDYSLIMVKSFADRQTQELYVSGKSKRFPPDVSKRAARKLEYVDLATRLEDLRIPPGNRLHALEGDREGQYSISINDQWRICFRFVDGDAFDVEVCDYH